MTDIFTIETATVYRVHASGRRYLTRTAAIVGHAKARFKRKHPCECEGGDYSSGYPGYTCDVHGRSDRVLPRYVRFLRFVLKRRSKLAMMVDAVAGTVA